MYLCILYFKRGDIDGTCEIWCGFVQNKDKLKTLLDKKE